METSGLLGGGWLMMIIMEEFANVKYFTRPGGEAADCMFPGEIGFCTCYSLDTAVFGPLSSL